MGSAKEWVWCSHFLKKEGKKFLPTDVKLACSLFPLLYCRIRKRKFYSRQWWLSRIVTGLDSCNIAYIKQKINICRTSKISSISLFKTQLANVQLSAYTAKLNHRTYNKNLMAACLSTFMALFRQFLILFCSYGLILTNKLLIHLVTCSNFLAFAHLGNGNNFNFWGWMSVK